MKAQYTLFFLSTLSFSVSAISLASVATSVTNGFLTHEFKSQSAFQGSNSTNLYQHAISLMEKSPLIDTHVDLPQIMREVERHPLDAIPSIATGFPGHVDIPRMRQGRLGGVFFTVWTPCPDSIGQDPGPDFLSYTNSVRDGFESLDLIQNLIAQHPNDFQLATNSSGIRSAFGNKKIAALIGMEGTHILGNSLSTLRIYAQLGVKYLTLTHVCSSSFASSAGDGSGVKSSHVGNGLSDFGRALVPELNRLGIMVDLSHVSDETMRESIALSKAPVVFTHSGARAVNHHPRNVPDDVLALIGDGEGLNSGIVLSVFYPPFIDPKDATVARVADHIEHIANIVGKKHVGIASDFDGMYSSVAGLEDASKYPHLIMELISRGWSDLEIEDVMGGNLMRVMDAVDLVAAALANELPSNAIYEARTDLPAKWGGRNDHYLPIEVKKFLKLRRSKDEL